MRRLIRNKCKNNFQVCPSMEDQQRGIQLIHTFHPRAFNEITALLFIAPMVHQLVSIRSPDCCILLLTHNRDNGRFFDT